MRRSLQNYRADWVEGLWVWQEQETGDKSEDVFE